MSESLCGTTFYGTAHPCPMTGQTLFTFRIPPDDNRNRILFLESQLENGNIRVSELQETLQNERRESDLKFSKLEQENARLCKEVSDSKGKLCSEQGALVSECLKFSKLRSEQDKARLLLDTKLFESRRELTQSRRELNVLRKNLTANLASARKSASDLRNNSAVKEKQLTDKLRSEIQTNQAVHQAMQQNRKAFKEDVESLRKVSRFNETSDSELINRIVKEYEERDASVKEFNEWWKLNDLHYVLGRGIKFETPGQIIHALYKVLSKLFKDKALMEKEYAHQKRDLKNHISFVFQGYAQDRMRSFELPIFQDNTQDGSVSRINPSPMVFTGRIITERMVMWCGNGIVLAMALRDDDNLHVFIRMGKSAHCEFCLNKPI
jgi:hypothetical protein